MGDHDPRAAELLRRIGLPIDDPKEIPEPDSGEPWPFLDWRKIFTSDAPDEDWLLDPVFPRGRGIALVAAAKKGKSYLLLNFAAALATGRPILHQNGDHPAIRVLYIDLEMSEADVRERLEIFGYSEDDVPALEGHLCYMLNPDLPSLDTKKGGEAIIGLCEDHDIDFVVIDTLGKAIQGDENDADSLRAFYRHTGQLLKRNGITWVRADHLGKDPTKGARGTSAKNDDVDLVWQLVRDEGGHTLIATHRRLGWVPETVSLRYMEDVDHAWFKPTPRLWPEGTQAIADRLDELGVPATVTSRIASKALKDAGQGVRNTVVCAAQKWRSDPAREREASPEAPF